MRIPVIKGVIDRRILVNYRIDPNVLRSFLPQPFRPKLCGGFGVAGICLIRLREIRPAFIPLQIGIGSENAAHRVAVEWDAEEGVGEGVYIPRRDTSSRLNTWLGGRVFPGIHHHAKFQTMENERECRVEMIADDCSARVAVAGVISNEFPTHSIFSSLHEASAFFERGSLGYSRTSVLNVFDGLELRILRWNVQPLSISTVRSSFFEDRDVFPEGSVQFDCALLMRDVEHEWHGRESLCHQ